MRESGFAALLRFCGAIVIIGGIAVEGGLIAGGAGEGPLLRDAWFADAFLCCIQQRRGVVLGRQLLRTSDALRCFLLMGLMIGGGGKASFGLTAFCFTRAGWRQHHDHSIRAPVCIVYV
jgi:hypothetical protein